MRIPKTEKNQCIRSTGEEKEKESRSTHSASSRDRSSTPKNLFFKVLGEQQGTHLPKRRRNVDSEKKLKENT